MIPPRAFWHERHVDGGRGQLERRGDLVADLHGQRLAERALVAEA